MSDCVDAASALPAALPLPAAFWSPWPFAAAFSFLPFASAGAAAAGAGAAAAGAAAGAAGLSSFLPPLAALSSGLASAAGLCWRSAGLPFSMAAFSCGCGQHGVPNTVVVLSHGTGTEAYGKDGGNVALDGHDRQAVAVRVEGGEVLDVIEPASDVSVDEALHVVERLLQRCVSDVCWV